MFRRFRRRRGAGVDELSSMPNLAPSSESFDVSENAESCENTIPQPSTTPLYTLSRIQSIQIDDMIDESSNSEFDGIIREALVSRKTKEHQIILEDDDSKVEDSLKILHDGSFSSVTEISEDAELVLRGVDKRLQRFYKKRAKWKLQDGDDTKQKRSSLFGGWTLRTGKTITTKPQATTKTIYSSWGGEQANIDEGNVAVEEFDDPLADFDSGFDDIDRWKSRNRKYDDEILVRDDSETKNQAKEAPSRQLVQVELSRYIQLVERTRERLTVLRRSRIALEALMEGTKSELQRAQSLVTRCTVKGKISSLANIDEFKPMFTRDVDEQNSKAHPSGATSTVLEKPPDASSATIHDGTVSPPPDTVLLIEQKKERLAVLRRSRCALEALMEGTKSDLKRAESLVERCTATWPSPDLLLALIEVEEEVGDDSTTGSQSSPETSSQYEEDSKRIRPSSSILQFSPRDVMSRFIRD